jgi:hypothetical protein
VWVAAAGVASEAFGRVTIRTLNEMCDKPRMAGVIASALR